MTEQVSSPPCKGMNDLLPAEARPQWEWFEARVTDWVLARYGCRN